MACDVEPVRTPAEPDAVMASMYTVETNPIVPDVAADFPRGNCRQGYQQRGPSLCISELKPRDDYMTANSVCRNQRGYVCSYEDMSYLYENTGADANYDPNNRMMGPLADDDLVYCGNRSITSDNDQDMDNFEGTCSKMDRRRYWCCHDRD
jgi:hypothetical protein